MSKFAEECNRIADQLHAADDRLPLVRAYDRLAGDGRVVLLAEGEEVVVSAMAVKSDLPINAVRACIWKAMQRRLDRAELAYYLKEEKK